MIRTPKERFLADAALAKWHADTVSTPEFAAALEAALLEYSAQCAKSEPSLTLRGAHEFARLFCNLSTPITRPTTIDRDNL